MSKGNTPRRKRFSKAQRLKSGAKWLRSYSGKNIVKGFSKWYGVDKLCAIKELRMLGFQISVEYEEQIKRSIQDIANARKLRKEKREKAISLEGDSYSDETFAFIAGYTSNDVPFGITHEEWAEMDKTN